MSDNLIIDGGEAGGEPQKILFKRAELEVMRKLADRYPFLQSEREEMVECVVDIARRAKSNRLKLSALKVAIAMEKVNLDELKTYVSVKRISEEDLQPAPGSTVLNNSPTITIIEQLVVKGESSSNGNGHANGSVLPGAEGISPK